MTRKPPAQTENLTDSALRQYRLIVDVRSPSEYSDDRIPGAVNMPVLNDQERAEVGTLYKQVSQFDARRIGGAYVSRNIANHLETGLQHFDPEANILAYCWRGGMRSEAFAQVLTAVGWKVTTVKGGYKTWRRMVASELEDLPAKYSLFLIDGQTGTGKTEVLHELAAGGQQVIDLEGIAKHRGSVFGGLIGVAQPTQKAFETALYATLRQLDPSRPVFLEAESIQIGRCRIPAGLWNKMVSAYGFELTADHADRVCFLHNCYQDLISDPDVIEPTLERLRRYHSNEMMEEWMNLFRLKKYTELIGSLVEHHYDPAYKRSRKKRQRTILESIRMPVLDSDAIKAAATRCADQARRQSKMSMELVPS